MSSLTYCPVCLARLPAGATTCKECGNPITQSPSDVTASDLSLTNCPRCHNFVSQKNTFCTKCGFKLETQAARAGAMDLQEVVTAINAILFSPKNSAKYPAREPSASHTPDPGRLTNGAGPHPMPMSAPAIAAWFDPLAYTLFAEFCVGVASAIAYDALKHGFDKKKHDANEKEIARLNQEIARAQSQGKDEALQLINDAIKLVKSIGSPSNTLSVDSSGITKSLESRGWTSQDAESKARQIAQLLTTIGVQNLNE